MSATPNFDAFCAALAASPDHADWKDPLWALAYYEAQCVFDSYTTKDLASIFRDPESRGALADLSTPEAAEAHLADVLSWWDDETPFFEAVLEVCS